MHIRTHRAPTSGVARFIAESFRDSLRWKAVLFARASGDLRLKTTVLLLGTDEVFSLNVELDQRAAHWCLPDTDMAALLRTLEE